MSPLTKANKTSFKKGNVPWNKGKPLPKWFKEILSKARLDSKYHTGELHPRWKGGTRSYYKTRARKLLMGEKRICFLCFSSKNVDIHHIDLNWKNNIKENVIYLCHICHMKLHHKIRKANTKLSK